MSNFSANEPTASQLTSEHLATYCDPTNAEFYIQNTGPQLREEPLSPSLFQSKQCQDVTSPLVPLNEEDNRPIHFGFSTCSQSTNVLPTNLKTLSGISDVLIIQRNIPDHHACITTSRASTLNSCEHGRTVASTTFDDPYVTKTIENFSDTLPEEFPLEQSSVIAQEQEKHLIHFPIVNNFTGAERSVNTPVCFRNESSSIFHKAGLNPITFKPSAPSLDKKEMRARRNRESARRSRMKSKQNFQALERSLVVMNKENTALRLVVEKLLFKCIETSPHMRSRLRSLFEEKL